MALSDTDVQRARTHLGYGGTTESHGFFAGTPITTQHQSLFETAIRNLRAEAEPQVIDLLNVLDEIECQLRKVPSILFAERTAGGTAPNLKAGDDLEREFVRWAHKLCDVLACIPYPFSARFQPRGRVGNVRVRG